MDRLLYKDGFTEKKIPAWVCPTCEKAVLKIKKETFKSFETATSKANHNHPEWGPEYLKYIFSCVFECTNPQCRELVSCSGEGQVEEFIDEDERGIPFQDFVEFFQPKYFYPNLKIFTLPDEIPLEVLEKINKSFELFFCNPNSAGNQLRVSLEALLTHLKIKRFTIRKKKQYPIMLHDRINALPKKYEKIQEYSEAIKWLGNAGSHSNKEITKEDVLDGYTFMELVLKEIFDNNQKIAKQKAKIIIKKKGP